METGVRTVLVTAPDAETARRLGRALVEEGLAACANVVPGITSIFRWQGAVQEEGEALAILKTTAEAAPRLRERVLALHPYDVPEILELPVAGGHDGYLDWVRDQVTG